MTIEEKAKAYDDAMLRADEAVQRGCLDKGMFDIIFPPDESEDERIRRLLVWQVHRNIEDETNDLAQSVYDGIKWHDPDLEESIEDWKKCLAYLEKQKELDKMIVVSPEVWDNAISDAFENGKKEGEKQKEQKPWSEEDENAMKYLHELISFGFVEKFFDAQTAADMRKWLNTRFKSLRPRPHWKPSKEQVDAVRYFVNKHQSEAWAATGQWKEFTALRGLFDILQKLM